MTPFLANESTSTLTRVDGADLGIDGLAVVEMIGRGGFGAVYRVRDEAHGRDVAVKVLPALLDDSARRQFDRERRAMGALSDHPGIGTVHTSGFTTNGEPYIAMQLMGGGSLADRIAKGPLEINDALQIGAAMADALAAAHAAGVLHLDIKPENILFTALGEPKLVDFGIAKLADDTRATSTIRATPAYAAPEVLEGQTATPAADVYSLAVTIYAALMGEAPFSGDSMLTVLRRIAVEPVPVITRLDVPAPIASLLRRAMDKSPEARPGSMEQFAAELRSLSAGLDTVVTELPGGASPSSTVMFAPATPVAPTNTSGGWNPTPPAVSGPVPLFGSAPPGSVVTGPVSPSSVPAGSVPPGSPPPGAVPYVAPAKRPTGLIIGGVAAAVIALVAVVALATRGGGEPTAGAATTVTETSLARAAVTTPPTPVTTPAPTTVATTVAPVTTAAPATTAPAPTTTITVAPQPTQPPAVFPVVTEVRWGNGLDEFNRALPTGSYFPDGTTEICVSWTANNFDVGAPWSITWSYEGAVDPALGGAGTVASTIDPYFACVFNDGGVFPGLYEMVWRVNEQVAFVDNLYVGGGRPQVVVTMINGNDLPICRLNVSPSTAEFWGRDVLDRATIDVDGAFDVAIAAGLYDVRATECDGTEIAVQTGIDFQANAPFVIVGSG